MTSPHTRATSLTVDFDELLSDPAVVEAVEDSELRSDLVAGLVALRKMAGMTQKQVAEAMQTTQSAISDLESGSTDPHLSTYQRYARAVGGRVSAKVETRTTFGCVGDRFMSGRIHVTRGAAGHASSSYLNAWHSNIGTRSGYAPAAS